MSIKSIVPQVQKAGVIGAGGAAFPTWFKLKQPVQTLIVNGAECEPILRKDNRLMQHYTEELIRGIRLVAAELHAGKCWIGIKGKNSESIRRVERAIAGDENIQVAILRDYYPAGDEVNLIHDITGKTVPPAGIPLMIGIVVMNVETLINVARAVKGQPVTHTMVTISGAVKNPVTRWLPVGISYREAIESAGGARVREYHIIDGGPMMGHLKSDMNEPVVKATSGIIVVPSDHGYVQRLTQTEEVRFRIGKSVCDQCSLCTEMCPRYNLGYTVEPHRVMRHQFMVEFPPSSRWGEICCECGICTLIACPENLDPRLACQLSKSSLKEQGVRYDGPIQAIPKPMLEYRQMPSLQVLKRIGLFEYNHEAPFDQSVPTPSEVHIRLSQHIGKPAVPVVSLDEHVNTGQLIADVEEGELGTPVHSSIAGTVIEINETEVVIR